jgi:hypothetical protein
VDTTKRYIASALYNYCNTSLIYTVCIYICGGHTNAAPSTQEIREYDFKFAEIFDNEC